MVKYLFDWNKYILALLAYYANACRDVLLSPWQFHDAGFFTTPPFNVASGYTKGWKPICVQRPSLDFWQQFSGRSFDVTPV